MIDIYSQKISGEEEITKPISQDEAIGVLWNKVMLLLKQFEILKDNNKKILQKFFVTVEELERIKGVGLVSAKLVLKDFNGCASWDELRSKGVDYYLSLLKDDVALILWQQILNRTGG